MVRERFGHDMRLLVGRESTEPNQHNPDVNQPPSEDEFAEVLVGRKENRFQIAAALKDQVIGDSWLQLGDVKHLVPERAKPSHNLAVNAFIGNDLHPAMRSVGYTTSARKASAAKAIAARTASAESLG